MIKRGKNMVRIYTEATPNPETLKFVTNQLIYPGNSIDFPDANSSESSPMATELFKFPFIRSVFIAGDFVTLTKTPGANWNEAIPLLKHFLKKYLESGKPVIREDEIEIDKLSNGNAIHSGDPDIVKKIKEILDRYVRPAVEMDGGAILFRSYDNGILNLKLQGSCSGCPSSIITLKAGVESIMKRMIPELKDVVAKEE